MVPGDSRSVTLTDDRTWHDSVIEHGLVALLVFAPLAFGSVTIWASSIVQATAFVIFDVWLLKAASRASVELRFAGILVPVGVFVLITVFQLVPLPGGLLAAISPGADAIYRASGPQGSSGPWRPISVYPGATVRELLNLLSYVAVFVVVVHHFRGKRKILLLARTIVLTGCFLVFIAVLQKAAWNGRLYWFYPVDPALDDRIKDIWGPYVNRNHFAGYLEMAGPLAMGMVLYLVSRSRTVEKTVAGRIAGLAGRRDLMMIVLIVLAVAVMSGALFASLSRGAMLGYAFSAAVFVLLARSRRSLRGKMPVLVLAGILTVAVGVFAAWDRIEARFSDLAAGDRVQRVQVWSDLGGMVRAFPFLGTGLGTFDRVYPRFQTKYSTIFFEHAENDYLEFLTDSGIVGLLIMLLLGVIFFLTALRSWRRRRKLFSTCMGLGGIASCSAMAVHSLTDFNLRVPANALLVTVIAGLTLASVSRGTGEGRSAVRDEAGPAPHDRGSGVTG